MVSMIIVIESKEVWKLGANEDLAKSMLLQKSNVRIQKLPKNLALKYSITFSKQHEDFVIMGAKFKKPNLKYNWPLCFIVEKKQKKLCSITKMRKPFF
jgi:hypothetical protein